MRPSLGLFCCWELSRLCMSLCDRRQVLTIDFELSELYGVVEEAKDQELIAHLPKRDHYHQYRSRPSKSGRGKTRRSILAEYRRIHSGNLDDMTARYDDTDRLYSAICIETIQRPDQVSALSCLHLFHGACFHQMVEAGISRCPICKRNMGSCKENRKDDELAYIVVV